MALAASSRTAKHKGIHQDNSRSITATVARLHQPQVLANCFGTTIICNASWEMTPILIDTNQEYSLIMFDFSVDRYQYIFHSFPFQAADEM
jgi:hypothetical protein